MKENSKIFLRNKNEQKFIFIKASGEWGISNFPHQNGCFRVQSNYDYINLTNPLNFTLTLSGRSNDLLIEYLEKNEIKIYEEFSNQFISIENGDSVSVSNDSSSILTIFEIYDSNRIKNEFYFKNGSIVYLNCEKFESLYLCNYSNGKIDLTPAVKAPRFVIHR